MIVETYEEFSNNYHNGLIKENKLLKEENKILKEEKEYLLDGFTYSGEGLLEEANKLLEENEELKTFKEQAEEECSASPVFEKMIDEIRNLEQKNEILEENINELKCGLRCEDLMKDNIIKNLILSIIINSQSGVRDWSEWKISSNYKNTFYNNEEYHKYYQKVIKEMNDTDWNDDDCYCNLVYHNDYTITTAFNDSSSDDSDSDDSDSDDSDSD